MKAGGKRVVTRHRQSSQSDKTEHVVDEDFPEQEVLVVVIDITSEITTYDY